MANANCNLLLDQIKNKWKKTMMNGSIKFPILNNLKNMNLINFLNILKMMNSKIFYNQDLPLWIIQSFLSKVKSNFNLLIQLSKVFIQHTLNNVISQKWMCSKNQMQPCNQALICLRTFGPIFSIKVLRRAYLHCAAIKYREFKECIGNKIVTKVNRKKTHFYQRQRIF